MSLKGKDSLPITDFNMTRFMITLEEAIELVWNVFKDMQGGEIYTKKIPSMKITKIAQAIDPKANHELIGIRPGEKIHEVMCPSDDSHLTIKFKDFFIICPSIVYFSRNNEFTSNSLGEIGEEVIQGFEYNSGTNSEFLNIEEIKSYNQLSKY